MNRPDISVVIPAYNEEENLPALLNRVNAALTDYGRPFEVICVNDASTDSTEEILGKIHEESETLGVIHLSKKGGKAAALERGFELVRGKYIVIIDADLQQDPEDIPKLILKLEKGYDVVSGKRTQRQDAPGKLFTSRMFNVLMRLVTGLRIDDYFSGLKAFRYNVIHFLSLYGDLYRFASVFAYKEGFKVAEVDCAHHARAHGASKYSKWGRFRMALRDLITVMFSITLSRKRIYLLGIVGLLCLSIALALMTAALYEYGCSPFLFRNVYGFLGLCLFFLGGQIAVIKKMADDFYVRHYDEFFHRQRNVRCVLEVRGQQKGDACL